jgi:UDP-2,4-diacetamido-2,4,6-trideoxy-beta-L-altropyranose hydrolase
MINDSGVLIVRADASSTMGGGHLMRCLALALEWQASGGRVVFLTNCSSIGLRKRLLSEVKDVRFVDRSYPDPLDLEMTLSALAEIRARTTKINRAWVVIDGFHFDPSYQRTIRQEGFKLFVIDDVAKWPFYHADIIMNQNIHADHLRYACHPHTVLLLGTRYVLMRTEFLQWRNGGRDIPRQVRKVLVTMGASDPQNLTGTVIQQINREKYDDLEVRVIVGPANCHKDQFSEIVTGSSCRIELLYDVTNMAELMAWADLAIAGGGSTCWELCAMGVPMILLVIVDHQKAIVEGLASLGVAVPFDFSRRGSEERFVSLFRELIFAREQRSVMAKRSRSLVDCRGAKRVVAEIAKHSERLKCQASLATYQIDS